MPQAPNRFALVTGAGKRIGRWMALDLAQNGWNLCLHFRHSRKEAEEVAQIARSLGRTVHLFQADLAMVGGAEGLKREVLDAMGTDCELSLIVHSASVWERDGRSQLDRETWEKTHRLHVWTLLVLTQIFDEFQGTRTAPAQILTLLDSRVKELNPQTLAYSFSKNQLASLTRFLATELAPSVRVNAILPGALLASENEDQEKWNKAVSATAMKKAPTQNDFLEAFRYLINTPSVTGQFLYVDAGRSLKGGEIGSF